MDGKSAYRELIDQILVVIHIWDFSHQIISFCLFNPHFRHNQHLLVQCSNSSVTYVFMESQTQKRHRLLQMLQNCKLDNQVKSSGLHLSYSSGPPSVHILCRFMFPLREHKDAALLTSFTGSLCNLCQTASTVEAVVEEVFRSYCTEDVT